MAIKIDNLTNVIVKELQQYTKMVQEDVDKAKKEVAKEAVKELKQTSPERTGDYAEGWATKKDGDKQVIYNKTDYQLTHLLEKGFYSVKKGERIPPQVHIKPVEEKAIKQFTKKVEDSIKGG